jgi:hypothetical protein
MRLLGRNAAWMSDGSEVRLLGRNAPYKICDRAFEYRARSVQQRLLCRDREWGVPVGVRGAIWRERCCDQRRNARSV